MKELSIEEKAKAYDRVVKEVKDFFEGRQKMYSDVEQTLEYLFPELAESEDERIRKEIIDFVKSRGGFKGDWIAWLEKQGEQKTVVIIPKFRVGDVIRPKGSKAEYTIESISGELYYGKGWGLHISYDDDYELVEQKSAWSEEDEDMLRFTIEHFEIQKRNSFGGGLRKKSMQEFIDWLKSLKERYTWKPSDEQMNALKHAFNDCSIAFADMKILATLYEQLKALHRYEQDT